MIGAGECVGDDDDDDDDEREGRTDGDERCSLMGIDGWMNEGMVRMIVVVVAAVREGLRLCGRVVRWGG